MEVASGRTPLTGRVGRSYSLQHIKLTISVTLHVLVARDVCLTEWHSVGCRSVWLEVRYVSLTYLLASGKGLLFVFLSLDVGELIALIAAEGRVGLLSP